MRMVNNNRDFRQFCKSAMNSPMPVSFSYIMSSVFWVRGRIGDRVDVLGVMGTWGVRGGEEGILGWPPGGIGRVERRLSFPGLLDLRRHWRRIFIWRDGFEEDEGDTTVERSGREDCEGRPLKRR
jgi:hypothetical protein